MLSFHACGNSHQFLTDLLLVSNLSRLAYEHISRAGVAYRASEHLSGPSFIAPATPLHTRPGIFFSAAASGGGHGQDAARTPFRICAIPQRFLTVF